MVFKPKWWMKNVLSIDEEFIKSNHLRGLILDLDNTLSMHGSPAAEEGVMEWLEQMKRLGVRMTVVSNNTKKRVDPLAKELGLDYISFGCKPLTIGITRALKQMRLPKKSVALVGDQIFTDIIGGNLKRIPTILVEPFHLEDKPSFKLKRKLESVIFKRDYTKLK
ncbi:MAG: YqeG family HAD IIIA-type phosphatase [Oscillospiraceae bacterium]|nr:YqeG family HAD IIIA-type phosphatase [Oscillospiraceae bacterium]